MGANMMHLIKLSFILILLLISCRNGDEKDSNITEIDIYFISLANRAPFNITCDVLERAYEEGFLCEDIQELDDEENCCCGYLEIIDSKSINAFLRLIGEMRLNAYSGLDEIDARICCRISNKDGNIIKTISFANPPLMQIDGVVYERDEDFFKFVVSFLPDGYLD